MAEQLAIDVSNYQGDLAQDVYHRWYAEGARTVICGTDGNQTHPVVFPQQIAKARAAGLETEAYVYLYFSVDVVRRTNLKLDMCDQVGGIRRVWLDCEDTTSGKPPGELVGLIAAARDAVHARGYECGVYTGRWWWEPYTGSSTGFADLPLWLAQYDGSMSLDMAPLSGWTEMVRKQFTDKGTLGGISPLDLNVERVPVSPAPPTNPDDFQRGRREMRDGWMRVERSRRESEDAYRAYVDGLDAEWGIP